MLRKHLFNTKKRATGSAGKSGSAADASISSPEAKKPGLVARLLRSLLVRQASHPLLELRFGLKFQKSVVAPLCWLAL